MFVSRIFTAWRKLNLEQALFLAAKPVFQRNSGECTRISPRFGHTAPGATRESGLTLVNDAQQLACLPAPLRVLRVVMSMYAYAHIEVRACHVSSRWGCVTHRDGQRLIVDFDHWTAWQPAHGD